MAADVTLASEVKELIHKLQVAGESYASLSAEDQKATRGLIYKQTGRLGHVFLKAGNVPAEKSVLTHLVDVTVSLAEKEEGI